MYNKTAFEGEPPKTSCRVAGAVGTEESQMKGKVATFDPEKSAQAFVDHGDSTSTINDKLWNPVTPRRGRRQGH